MGAESRAGGRRPSEAVLVTVAATVVLLVCGIATGMISARSLAPAGRGQLAAITIWASTLAYAGTFGWADAVGYFSAAEPGSRVRVWTTGQAGAGVLGILITGIGWWVLPLLFSSPGDAAIASRSQWYLLFFAIPWFSWMCAFSWLQGAGRLAAFNVSRVSAHVVNALGFVMLLLAGDASVWHFALVLLVGNAAAWLLTCALGPWRSVRVEAPSPDLARRMFHYGIRVQVGNWSSAVNVRLDQLLLSLVASPASLGVYVVAVTYANVVTNLPGSAAMVMMPELVNEHRQGTARACLVHWYRRMLWTTVAGCAVVAASGVYLVPFLFGSAYESAVPLLALLGPASVLLGMNQLLITAFQGIDRPEIGSAAEVLALVVTGASLVALLPRYGLYGAATAQLLAHGTSHAYLLHKAMAVFGAEFRSMCMPTGADVQALRRAAAPQRATS